jgi:hypothetical protein
VAQIQTEFERVSLTAAVECFNFANFAPISITEALAKVVFACFAVKKDFFNTPMGEGLRKIKAKQRNFVTELNYAS